MKQLLNGENEQLKMRRTEVGKIAVAVSAEQALAVLWAIKFIECYEPKVDAVFVLPATQNKGTYFARGHFAGIPWSGTFTYELNQHGFYSEMKRGVFGVKVQGGFVVTAASLGQCLITHYERYEFPAWLSPFSLFVRFYLHRAMKQELSNLAQLIQRTVQPSITGEINEDKSNFHDLTGSLAGNFQHNGHRTAQGSFNQERASAINTTRQDVARSNDDGPGAASRAGDGLPSEPGDFRQVPPRTNDASQYHQCRIRPRRGGRDAAQFRPDEATSSRTHADDERGDARQNEGDDAADGDASDRNEHPAYGAGAGGSVVHA